MAPPRDQEIVAVVRLGLILTEEARVRAGRWFGSDDIRQSPGGPKTIHSLLTPGVLSLYVAAGASGPPDRKGYATCMPPGSVIEIAEHRFPRRPSRENGCHEEREGDQA